MQQIAYPRGNAWPVLDRGGHARREDRAGHGAASAAEAAMGAVFGDLQWLRFGQVEDLPADRRAVTVSLRQRAAAPGTGGWIVI